MHRSQADVRESPIRPQVLTAIYILPLPSRDFSHNKIGSMLRDNDTWHPLEDLPRLHDVMLSHNNISSIGREAFKGLDNLQIL